MSSAKHIELVEAVNNAGTKKAHDEAEIYLSGWRAGYEEATGRTPDLMGCDLYYDDQGIDRPMCCGVWLDWKESV